MRRGPGAAAALALLFVATAPAKAQPDARRSGLAFMSPALQAMQADDTANPGMLWVLEGERRWSEPAGEAGRACTDCHDDAAAAMRGVATRYPAIDERSGEPVDLAGRIALCRTRHQGAPRPAHESDLLLALSAYVAHQSRGLPISPPADPRLQAVRDAGRSLYEMRMGQLDLACAQCHDERAGERLAGSVIPQAHPTGYPIYRLEWQALGSLQRRIRGCLTGVRAEPFAYGAPELIALEAFLAERASGMSLETPGVRP